MITVFLILYNNMISILYSTSRTGVFFLMSTGSAFQSLGALAATICLFFYLPTTEVATCSPRLPIFDILMSSFDDLSL